MTVAPFDLNALLARHPLPWHVVEGDWDFGTHVADARDGLIATWLDDWPARLLAAAPGMVKAIQEIEHWLSHLDSMEIGGKDIAPLLRKDANNMACILRESIP